MGDTPDAREDVVRVIALALEPYDIPTGRSWTADERMEPAKVAGDALFASVGIEGPGVVALVRDDQGQTVVTGEVVNICQRLRAGWLPHRLSAGSWWWGRPADPEGFRLWSEGFVPSMAVVEQMTPEEVAAWSATLHPQAIESLPVGALSSDVEEPGEITHCAGRLAVAHERTPMVDGRCPVCGESESGVQV